MQILNVCAKKEYTKEGKKEVAWYKVGTIKQASSGKMYLRLFLVPHVEFHIFENDIEKAPDDLPVIT